MFKGMGRTNSGRRRTDPGTPLGWCNPVGASVGRAVGFRTVSIQDALLQASLDHCGLTGIEMSKRIGRENEPYTHEASGATWVDLSAQHHP